MHLLVIEDEQKLGDYLHKGLSESGFNVDLSRDGTEGLGMALTGNYDAIVLDVMLPGIDGFKVLEVVRKTASTPVLMLTTRDDVADRVKGLETGADDYLAKPFAFSELLARIRALLRPAARCRNRPASSSPIWGLGACRAFPPYAGGQGAGQSGQCQS